MPKVMIVDDDRMMVGLLSTLLELEGFDVVTVPDVHVLRDRAFDELPDAFVVDYNLKGVEGTRVVRWIRTTEQFQATPVLMSSGMDRELEAIASGANRFLLKPFDPAILVELLKQMLDE